MAKQDTHPQPVSVKDSLILNIRRNQGILQDQRTDLATKIETCEQVIELLESDSDGKISRFIELSNILQGGALVEAQRAQG